MNTKISDAAVAREAFDAYLQRSGLYLYGFNRREQLWETWQAALAATGKQQVGEAAILRNAAAVLDMWEGDPNVTGYMGDFKDACAILEELALHSSPTAHQVGDVQGDGRVTVRIGGVGQCTLTVTDAGIDIPASTIAALAARQPVGQEAVVTYCGRRLTPEGTRECWGVLAEGVEDLPRNTKLYAAPPAQGIDLSPIATRKLGELAEQGYVTNGVAIFNPSTGHRGLVDNLGFVGWMETQGIDLGQPNEPNRTLYVDLDGVMADFDGAFPTVFGVDHRSLADDAMWGHINSHPSFFRDLPPMAGALEFFRSIEHLNPVILTACPKSNYPHVAAQKRAWVREHLSQTCLVLPVLGGRHKPLFMHQPGDVLIDDFGKNCAAWTEAGGIAIKHEGDWAATRQALALLDSRPTLATVTPPRDPSTQLGEH